MLREYQKGRESYRISFISKKGGKRDVKTFFVDITRCTACRGCRVACKEWHGLPATKTKQWGSHQNPADLNAFTYKLVRFKEHKNDGKVVWNFFSEQCRHCLEPPCKDVADGCLPGAAIKDEETVAVIFTDLTKRLPKSVFEEMQSDCPYNIPRRDEKTGAITKCDMCIDRVKNGLLPMCVKTCPTGAVNFGDREEMLRLAYATLLDFYRQIFLAREDSRTRIDIAPIKISEDNLSIKKKEGFPLINLPEFVIDTEESNKLFRKLCNIAEVTNEEMKVSVGRIIRAIDAGDVDLNTLSTGLLGDDDLLFGKIADNLKVDAKVLAFITYNSIKPSLSVCASQLSIYLDENKPWERGYCPVC